jgi:isopentenyl-diphosphate delta-isomerase
MTEIDLSHCDPIQVNLLGEQCIKITQQDEAIGGETKKNCHLNSNIDKGLLHRAFSVFLFNAHGDLLLQQRAPAKITFPGYYTNTCCSHPLYRREELEEESQIGVKRAAQRKLEHELGIPPQQVPLDAFTFLTRIHYKAQSCETWGEHEIDYILFIQRDVSLSVNPNEVSDTRYVTQQQLKDLLASSDGGSVRITPWFQLICHHFLFKWWNNLSQLHQVTDVNNIHKMI